MTRLRRFLRLSGTDQLLAVRTILVVVAVRLGLWCLPLKTVLKFVARAMQRRALSGATAAKLIWAVRASSRLVPHASCLTQALAAHLMFARNGLDSDLCIGVARNEVGDFEAHAWLKHDGRVVIGDQPDLVLYCYGHPRDLHSEGRFS